MIEAEEHAKPPVRIAALVASLIVVLCLFVPSLSFAQTTSKNQTTGSQRKVLIIYSYGAGIPWQDRLSKGVKEGLSTIPPSSRPEIFEEHLYTARLGNRALNNAEPGALGLKYHDVALDAVITESQAAALLLVRNPKLFPGVPRYLFNQNLTSVAPQGNGTPRQFTNVVRLKKSIETVRTVLPNVHRVIAIEDHSVAGLSRIARLRKLAGELAPKLKLEVWDSFTLDELVARVRTLPKDSAVFYFPIAVDRLGRTVNPADAARRISRASSVPVFTIFDTLLGTGIVGGYVVSAERLGHLIADVAAYGDAALPSSQNAYVNDTMGYYFDAQQLKRWKIPRRALPNGSVIVDQQKTIWDLYSLYIEIALLAFIIETLLILNLFRLSRQRRRAIAMLAEERAHLEEKVAERTTELKKANTVLDGTSKERELLLQELQHRVKNSLAMIVSLVRLEAGRCATDEAKAALGNIKSRVSAVASLYDTLFRTRSVSEIEMGRYLDYLLDSIASSLGFDRLGITLEHDIHRVTMKVKRAISIGLIVNELVTDASKHAFPDGRTGTIKVSLKASGSELILEIVDDGVGLTEAISNPDARGLGMLLVESLSNELKGQLSSDNAPGARFRIVFPT